MPLRLPLGGGQVGRDSHVPFLLLSFPWLSGFKSKDSTYQLYPAYFHVYTDISYVIEIWQECSPGPRAP